jgi:hypothetical protein
MLSSASNYPAVGDGEQPTAAPSKTPRTRVTKNEVHCIVDAGRSRIKFQAFTPTASTPVITLDSFVCEVESLPFGERGAFSMTRRKNDQNKDVVEHWVVGSSARFQGKDFIAMSEAHTHKVDYFPILALGAIASLPHLYTLSTGVKEKHRTLHLHLSTLSLASPLALQAALAQCRWIMVDGVKYRVCLARTGCLGFPEGYGAALFTQKQLAPHAQHHTFYTFDIGFGTATLTEYSNLGSLPKRGMVNPNGGGGVATLLREFSEQMGNRDASRSIRPSLLQEILETSTLDAQGQIHATTPEGHEIGDTLRVAINAWIKDSPLTYALEKLGTSARRHPVTLCGGGFAIAPVRTLVVEQLLKAGIPQEHLLLPDEPGTVALAEMQHLFRPLQEPDRDNPQ